MKYLTISFLSIFIISNGFSQNYNAKFDTIYKVPNDKEVFFFNGYEPKENDQVDFVLKEGDKKVPFEIDKTCDEAKPNTCVSLYHMKTAKGYKWMLRNSAKSEQSMRVTYAQKMMDTKSAVVQNTTEIRPGVVKDLGYGGIGDNTKRKVWIVSASWVETIFD